MAPSKSQNKWRPFESYRKPPQEVWGVSTVQVRDPTTKAKWSGKSKETLNRGLFDSFVDKLFRSHGAGLANGRAMSFELLTCQRRLATLKLSLSNRLQDFLSYGFKGYFRHHLLAWLCFRRPSHITRNLSGFEKSLYFCAVCFHMLLVSAEIRGYRENTVYFISLFGDTSTTFDKLLLYLAPDYITRCIILGSSLALAVILQAVGRFSSGKFQRRLEDLISYWQGRNIIQTGVTIFMHNLEQWMNRNPKPRGIQFHGSSVEEAPPAEEDFTAEVRAILNEGLSNPCCLGAGNPDGGHLQPSRAAKKVGNLRLIC